MDQVNPEPDYQGSGFEKLSLKVIDRLEDSPYLRLIKKVKEKGEGWLTVYHPLTGFNFEEYGNLKMCDDCGPNRFDKKLSNLPLD